MPYCIGLTGGIGSGKSSAAKIFEELGAAIVDTDEIARRLTGPGGAATAAIREQFGDDYLTRDGSLDRVRMRKLVFGDPASRRKLESILHPLIRDGSKARLVTVPEPYVLLVVPLLLETGAYRDLINRVLVVDCDEEQQVERASRRSQLSADEVRAIMAVQLPRSERLARADDVLHNNADLTALRRQAEALHAKYLALAGRS
jgi:dephospho-CoA kinase